MTIVNQYIYYPSRIDTQTGALIPQTSSAFDLRTPFVWNNGVSIAGTATVNVRMDVNGMVTLIWPKDEFEAAMEASLGPAVDVDAILATGGVCRANGYDCTIDTTLLSTMANGITLINASDPDSTWTILMLATSLAGVRAEIVSDDEGEHLMLAGMFPGTLTVLGGLGNLTAPGTPFMVGISQVDGGAVIARANGAAYVDANLPVVGSATIGVGLPYQFIVDGGITGALIYIPSALTAEEIDAIYAATVF